MSESEQIAEQLEKIKAQKLEKSDLIIKAYGEFLELEEQENILENRRKRAELKEIRKQKLLKLFQDE
jgi:hypothetical protein